MDYYSLDALLAEQQKLPCVFRSGQEDAGHLLTGNEEARTIPPGMKIELPFWMARELSTRFKGSIEAEIPKVFGERVRQSLIADANVVNLQRHSPYFYQFGEKINELQARDELMTALLDAFTARLETVFDLSRNSYNKDMTAQTQKLDNTEAELFNLGKESAAAFQKWKDRKAHTLQASDAVVGNRRKRGANE